MYKLTDIREQLQENLPYIKTTESLQSSPGLMRRVKQSPKEEEPYNPQKSILDHIRRYRETATIDDGVDTQTVEELEVTRPTSRSDALSVTSLAENSGDWVTTTADVLRELEGFAEKPYWDVDAYRAGYGSDTYTTADGTVKTVVKGVPVSREDAERDLARRIQTEFGARAKETAGDAWDSYNAMQKAALASVAYNYGSIPKRISAAVRSGSPQEVSRAILTLADDNEGINRKRRMKEAEMMIYGVAG